MSRSRCWVALSLLAIACGPPRVPGAGEGGETSADQSTTEPAPDLPGDDPPETETESETGIDFVIDPDSAFPEPCDNFGQDCPPGEKCVPHASSGGTWDTNKCVPVLGDQGIGEPCSYDGPVAATDNCDGDGVCLNAVLVDGELVGTCLGFCTGSLEGPECPPASSCLVSGSGVINVCMPFCDPLAQNCGEGDGCYWDGETFACVFTAEQPSAIGQPCSFINDCAPGSMCVDAVVLPACQADSCCAPYCDTTLDPCDALLPGTACVPFFSPGDQPPGFEQVGICLSS